MYTSHQAPTINAHKNVVAVDHHHATCNFLRSVGFGFFLSDSNIHLANDHPKNERNITMIPPTNRSSSNEEDGDEVSCNWLIS